MALIELPPKPTFEYYSVLDEQWHGLEFGRNGNCALGSVGSSTFQRYFDKGFIRAYGAEESLNEAFKRIKMSDSLFLADNKHINK